MYWEKLAKRYIVTFVVLNIFLTAGFTCFQLAWAAEEMAIRHVETEGTGAIINNDVAGARQSAINDSFKQAVSEVITDLVHPKMIAENLENITKRFYGQAKVYVQDYRIVLESHDEKEYRVNVETTLLVGEIRDRLRKLGFLSEDNVLPVIYIAMHESRDVCRSVMKNYFEQNGFSVVAGEDYNTESSDETEDDLFKTGTQAGADLLVIGKAEVDTLSEGMECRAYGTARALKIDTREEVSFVESQVIAKASGEISGKDIALQNMSKELALRLKMDILNTWNKKKQEVTTKTVIIREIKEYSDFKAIKDVFQAQLFHQNKAGSWILEAGMAKTNIITDRNSHSLAEYLVAKTGKRLKLKIMNITDTEIEFRMIR